MRVEPNKSSEGDRDVWSSENHEASRVSPADSMRPFLHLRRILQAVFLAFFVYLVLATSTAFIGGHPIEWFLAMDPLLALGVALSASALTAVMAWSLVLIVLTLIFGRFFCGWICPLGTLQHFTGWLGRNRKLRERVRAHARLPSFRFKYLVLATLVGMALLGSNQMGVLDPIALSWRTFATVIVPAADQAAFGAYQGERYFSFAPLLASLFVMILAASWVWPRIYCRLLCPLGALLGLLARFSLFRLRVDRTSCKDCSLCAADCQGSASPDEGGRVSECMLCLSCVSTCPRGTISYGPVDRNDEPSDRLDVGRRRMLGAAFSGALLVPLISTGATRAGRGNPKRIRPPGARPEQSFLERCIKCGACIKACPTGGLQPALTEAGLHGLWTPVLVPKLGQCEHACVLCGQVCPTGAILELSRDKKVGSAEREPVRIGSAFIDRGRCLPWAMGTSCIVCEEVCPTSPKAIYFERVALRARNGTERTLMQPYVDLDHCVGCGACERHCPVNDRSAIRVTSVGESRDVRNRIILRGGRL